MEIDLSKRSRLSHGVNHLTRNDNNRTKPTDLLIFKQIFTLMIDLISSHIEHDGDNQYNLVGI